MANNKRVVIEVGRRGRNGDYAGGAEMSAVKTRVTTLETQIATKQDAAAVPEIVRDTIGAALLGGTGVTISVNDGADTITVNINTFAWLENTPRNVQVNTASSLRVAPNAGTSEIVLLGVGTQCLRFYAAWMGWSYVWTNGYGFGWIDTTKLTAI